MKNTTILATVFVAMSILVGVGSAGAFRPPVTNTTCNVASTTLDAGQSLGCSNYWTVTLVGHTGKSAIFTVEFVPTDAVTNVTVSANSDATVNAPYTPGTQSLTISVGKTGYWPNPVNGVFYADTALKGTASTRAS